MSTKTRKRQKKTASLKGDHRSMFPLADPELALQTIVHQVDEISLALTYDKDGRLCRAKATGKVRNSDEEYWADLELRCDEPSGGYRNSYGDIISWSDGLERSSGSYGPYEQEDEERIGFEPWVSRTLIMMVGKNC